MPYTCLKTQIWSLNIYTLLPIRKEDMQQIRIWRNDQIAILRQKNLLSIEDQERYYMNHVQPSYSLEHPQNVLFSFLEGDVLIGYGGLVHLDWQARKAEISFILNTERILKDDVVPKAMGTLIELLLQVAFHDLQLNEVTAEIYDWGTQRQKAIEQAGFKLIRKTENTKIINGKVIGSSFYSRKQESYELEKSPS